MPQSRRNFIKTVILSSGAVFVSWADVAKASEQKKNAAVTTASLHYEKAHSILRDKGAYPNFPFKPSLETDTVVIGGGAAGIAAAWKAKASGRDFLLLENEPVIGGVMHNPVPQWREISYPLGSTYFYRYNGAYKQMFNDFNIHPIETGEDALYITKTGYNNMASQDAIVVDWWNPTNISALPFAQKDKDAFRKFRDFLLAMPVPIYPLRSAKPADIDAYDPISAAEYVSRFGSDVLTDTMDMYARSVLGAPLAEVNAYSLLNFYSLEFGGAYNIPCYTFPGGMGAVAEKAYTYFGKDKVVTNALALFMRNTKKGVIVNFLDTATGEPKSVQVRSAVVAMQKKIAVHIVGDYPFDQKQAMSAMRYAPYITIALCCNAPLFPVRAFDFWISDKQRRFTDLIDVTSPSDTAAGKWSRMTGNFVYMLSSPRPETDRANLQDDKWLAKFAQDTAAALAEHVPDAPEKIEEMHVFAWGHSMVIPAVGSYRKIFPYHANALGAIRFANADNDLAPGIENAMEAGMG